MLKWIKGLFGKKDTPQKVYVDKPVVIEQPVVEKEAKPVTKPTKAAKRQKKAAPTVDYTTMTKDELLREAKKKKIKANASLKKDELIERLKSAD